MTTPTLPPPGGRGQAGEYHVKAEDLPDGRVRTGCGKVIPASDVYGPGHKPCRQCYANRLGWRGRPNPP